MNGEAFLVRRRNEVNNYKRTYQINISSQRGKRLDIMTIANGEFHVQDHDSFCNVRTQELLRRELISCVISYTIQPTDERTL